MSNHDDQVSVRQMLDHAREIVALARGKTREDLDADRTLNLALARLMEIIGEAAGRVSDDYRAARPDIPWAQVIGLRNRLIHGYDTLDFDILWDIVSLDMPILVAALEKALDGQ